MIGHSTARAPIPSMRVRQGALAGVVAALLAGCAHAPEQGDLSRFAEATAKVHGQADAGFVRANAVSRQAAVDVFVASHRPGLSERAFPPVVDADAVAAWDDVLPIWSATVCCSPN